MSDESSLLFDHGGDLEKAAKFAGCPPEDLLDFSNLLNPSGTPPGLAEALKPKLAEAFRHPSSGEALRSKIAGKMKIPMEQILLGAGTTEFIRFLPWVKRPQRPVILGPTYGDYVPALRMVDSEPQWILALEEQDWSFPQVEWDKALESKPDWVILARPNNPLGQNWPFDNLFQAMEKHPEIFFVVDETCVEISDNPEDSFLSRPLPSNAAVLRSFSKTYAVPGLRLGYMVVSARFAGLWKQVQIPWTVSPSRWKRGFICWTRKNGFWKPIKKISRKRNVFTASFARSNSLKLTLLPSPPLP